jgi:hypothetical protein
MPSRAVPTISITSRNLPINTLFAGKHADFQRCLRRSREIFLE